MQTTHLAKLTKRQREVALTLFETGYVNYYTFPYGGRNKPCWALVNMGLAKMDFGPRGDWLQSYCFMPVWSDPVC